MSSPVEINWKEECRRTIAIRHVEVNPNLCETVDRIDDARYDVLIRRKIVTARKRDELRSRNERSETPSLLEVNGLIVTAMNHERRNPNVRVDVSALST